MTTPRQQNATLAAALRRLVARCPRLATHCYWAGTSAVSLEELGHRQSFDLDFHTRRALADVRPILAEIQKRFPGELAVVQAPDEFGSGFRAVLTLGKRQRVTIEVLSNYEDVPARDLAVSSIAPAIKRVTLARYLADKIQCVAERTEARDLVDIAAVLKRHPEMQRSARRLLGRQDALILAERLLAWTDKAIAADLAAAYKDVRVTDAKTARKLLLDWLRAESKS